MAVYEKIPAAAKDLEPAQYLELLDQQLLEDDALRYAHACAVDLSRIEHFIYPGMTIV